MFTEMFNHALKSLQASDREDQHLLYTPDAPSSGLARSNEIRHHLPRRNGISGFWNRVEYPEVAVQFLVDLVARFFTLKLVIFKVSSEFSVTFQSSPAKLIRVLNMLETVNSL